MNLRTSRIMVLINAERKKLGVLGVLLLCLTAAGVRAFVMSGPRSAVASVRSSASGGAEKDAEAEDSASARVRKTDIRLRIPAELERDLFALNEAHFPKPSQTELPDADIPKSAPAKDETPSRVEPVRPEDQPEAKAAADLRRLRLKGTILGGSPMAVIELAGQKDKRGTMVRPGGEIDGFTLVEINSDGVVLEKYGVRVELKRALPEG